MKVLLCLVASMTTGTFILLSFEGRPIKPMEFSLSSEIQAPLKPVHQALGTEQGIALGRWKRIEISYQQDNGFPVDGEHLSGPLALEYHFVISNGPDANDGTIIATPRWTHQLACIDTINPSLAQETIRICLIGDPLLRERTPKQERRLEALVSSLIRHCNAQLQVQWR